MTIFCEHALGHMNALLHEAQTHYTSCGDGSMVWRRWGQGRPLVLLHGGSGSWTHWIKTIPALRENYTLWVVDLPGLGSSAMPEEPHTPQSCASAFADGFKQLVASGTPATMICFSFGCHVGTLAATELNEYLSSLCIIGSAALGLGRPQNIILPKERTNMTEHERRTVHYSVLENLMFADVANIDDQAIALQSLNVTNARFRSRRFADTSSVRDALAGVSVPVKAIWGSRDIVAHPDVNSCLSAVRLHHPELQHHVIDNAGHWVMYEAADAFNAALIDLVLGHS